MEKKIRKILDTTRYSDETWEDVMVRVNRTGGVDLKILYQLVGIILDKLDGKEKEKK